jgi:ribosome-associated translation inhibitor RaiA
MKISIQPPSSGASKALTDFINKELAALSNTSRSIYSADVRLRQDKAPVAQNKICEIYLGMVEKNIFAVQKGRTYEEAMQKALDKLRNHVANMKQLA